MLLSRREHLSHISSYTLKVPTIMQYQMRKIPYITGHKVYVPILALNILINNSLSSTCTFIPFYSKLFIEEILGSMQNFTEN